MGYWLWQQLPSLLSSISGMLSNVGGYGKKLKRLSSGNKWNSAPAAYDEYDYYTSGTEHYVSFWNMGINIFVVHKLMHVQGAFCGCNQPILCQKIVQPEHSISFSMSINFPFRTLHHIVMYNCLRRPSKRSMIS